MQRDPYYRRITKLNRPRLERNRYELFKLKDDSFILFFLITPKN